MFPSLVAPSSRFPKARVASPTTIAAAVGTLALAGVLGAAGVANASTNFQWNGTTSSDFATASNWGGTAPTENVLSNGGYLDVANGTAHALDYTSAQGTTGFADDFLVGNNANGSMNITGGTLDVNTGGAQGLAIGNYSTGTLNMSGGTLNNEGGSYFEIGNGATGTINLSGGTITTSGSLNFSSGTSGSGVLNITGTGIFDVTGTIGTTFNGASGTTSYITLGAGNGVFEQTGTNKITFDATTGATSYINFLSGSGGQLSLNGETQAAYDALIASHNILVNSLAASPSDFQYTTVGSQDILSLAIPEPATLRLMSLGGLGILLLGRKRKSA